MLHLENAVQELEAKVAVGKISRGEADGLIERLRRVYDKVSYTVEKLSAAR